MSPIVNTISGTVLLVSAVAAVVFLAYEHIVTGGAAIAILATVISLGGGALAVHAGVKAGAAATERPNGESVSQQRRGE